MAGGRQDADLSVELVFDALSKATECSSRNSVELFGYIDRQLHLSREAGLTTLLVALIDKRNIFGASVGDSEAWVVSSNVKDLTEYQIENLF